MTERRQIVVAGTVLEQRTNSAQRRSPASVPELREAVRIGTATGMRIHTADLPAPAEDAHGTLALDLTNLCGLVRVDHSANTATFLAGTTVRQAAAELAEQGLAMAAAPADATLTLGTAASFGAHGHAMREQSFSGALAAITFTLADGSLLEVSARKNAQYWGAARLSLGAIGIVTEVTVRVAPYRGLRIQRSRANLAALVRELPEAYGKVDHYSAVFRPGHDGAKLTIGWLVAATPEQLSSGGDCRFVASADAATPRRGLFSRMRAAVAKLVRSGARRVLRQEAETRGEQARGVARALEGKTMIEYVFPAYRVGDVLEALQALAAGNRAFAHATGRLGMLAADDVWLSPAYRQDSVTVAVEVPDASGADLLALELSEELFIYHGGLPNWAGWNTFRAGEAADVMPRYSDFAHVAHDLDPRGHFKNFHTARALQ